MAEHVPPEQVDPQSLADYLEVMSKAVFQSGISWRVVEMKWDGTRDAFHGFDVEKVASMSDRDVDALAEDTRVIRNRLKLEAIVTNARRVLELADDVASFQSYLRYHADFEATVAALRKDFKFLGDMGCYYLLYVVGEHVPPHDQWMASRQRGR